MSWDRPLGRSRFFLQILRACLRDSGTPIFEVPECRRKICGESAQKSAQKSALKSAHCARKICAKICAKNLRKNLRINQPSKISAKNRTKNRCDDLLSLEDDSQKQTPNKSAPNLCKTFFLHSFAPTISNTISNAVSNFLSHRESAGMAALI